MRHLDNQALAEAFFEGDLEEARKWLLKYQPPRVAGLLFPEDLSRVHAYGPACAEKNFDEAYLRAPFVAKAQWVGAPRKAVAALRLLASGVSIEDAAKRVGVRPGTVYRKLKQLKDGELCESCGRRKLT